MYLPLRHLHLFFRSALQSITVAVLSLLCWVTPQALSIKPLSSYFRPTLPAGTFLLPSSLELLLQLLYPWLCPKRRQLCQSGRPCLTFHFNSQVLQPMTSRCLHLLVLLRRLYLPYMHTCHKPQLLIVELKHGHVKYILYGTVVQSNLKVNTKVILPAIEVAKLGITINEEAVSCKTPGIFSWAFGESKRSS